MANYAVLKAAVAAVVKTNGNQEITGNNLQLQLINIINTLTEGYQFLGVATPATEYTAGDANVAFIAGQMGTYADMGNLTLANGEVAVLKYNGSAWSKETLLNIGNFSNLFLPRPSDALVDTDGAGTEQEFTFRKSGGDGGAYYRKIKGKTIVEDDQLASNDTEAVETTGRNQYNPTTGKAQVIGGQTYYIGGTYTSLSQEGVAITPAGDGTFTPASTGEVEVVGGNATDTIINLSDADNGLWQPYWKRTLQLGITTRKDTDGNVPFADGMKGAGTAADWADKVGGEKQMGRLNLGSLDWQYDANSVWFYVLNQSQIKAATLNLITPNYATTPDLKADHGDKLISINISNAIKIADSAYTDPVAFKAAMQGVYLDYELATPVPFTWAEPLNLGVKVDENGTERAVAPEGATAPSAPFVADTTYTKSVEKLVAETSAAQTKADVLALVRANEDALLSALKTAEVITDYTLADTADADTGVFAVVINPE